MPDFLTQYGETLEVETVSKNLTFSESHHGKTVISDTANRTLTIPIGLKKGFTCRIIPTTTTTIAGASGVTANGVQALSFTTLYVPIIILGYAANTYAIFQGGGALNIPQVSKAVDYTTVLTDAGCHIYQTGASKTVTIDSNANVAYPIGTAITFIATNATGCSIAITSDVMTLANSTTTGTRTLAQNGIATAIKVTSTSWIIAGSGIS